ncbi:MAG TPA: hypothetical protein VKC56_07350 [Gallionellaceae bacterium]|nr:hypothetical protein [Gallionellaceae bacterium]
MEFKPAYQIFVADPSGLGDNPIIIVSACSNSLGNPKGEWFLIVPDEAKGMLLSQKIIIPHESMPYGESELLGDLLDQAKGRLRTYIAQTCGDAAKPLPAERIDATPSNPDLLLNFWRNSTYSDAFVEIHEKTLCKPLKDFLGWLIKLPP